MGALTAKHQVIPGRISCRDICKHAYICATNAAWGTYYKNHCGLPVHIYTVDDTGLFLEISFFSTPLSLHPPYYFPISRRLTVPQRAGQNQRSIKYNNNIIIIIIERNPGWTGQHHTTTTAPTFSPPCLQHSVSLTCMYDNTHDNDHDSTTVMVPSAAPVYAKSRK